MPFYTCNIAAIIFGIVMISGFFCENQKFNHDATQKKIAKIAEMLNEMIRNNQEPPSSLAELRIACRSENLGSIYDGFGNRLMYTKLSKWHYLIQSHEDDWQKTQNFATLYKTNLPSREAGLRYILSNQKNITTYPETLLLGADNDIGSTARLVIHSEKANRFLIIENHNTQKIYLARHPKVEEFLWVPGTEKIIYTATDMERYDDGIYLWDLETGIHTNLLHAFSQSTKPIGYIDEKSYYLSLHGADDSKEFYAFILPMNDYLLSPIEFYDQKNLYRITLPEEQNVATFSATTFSSSWPQSLHSRGQFISQPNLNGEQKAWLKLPISGNLETVIHAWQSFLISHPNSPLFAYSLWWLIHIYSDAYKLLEKSDSHQQHQTIRSYASELSGALANLETAPLYLRSMGRFLENQLMEGYPPLYFVSHLTLQENISSHQEFSETEARQLGIPIDKNP